MKKQRIVSCLALALFGVLCLVASPAPAEAQASVRDEGRVRPIHTSRLAREIAGSWVAELDLTPFLNELGLDIQRVETLLVYIDPYGGMLFGSEHEADKESTGFGIWNHLGGGRVGYGVAGFRYGEANICGIVGVMSPPGNCLLKLGGVFGRDENGNLRGSAVISVEGGGMEWVSTQTLDLTAERMGLGFFPGSTP